MLCVWINQVFWTTDSCWLWLHLCRMWWCHWCDVAHPVSRFCHVFTDIMFYFERIDLILIYFIYNFFFYREKTGRWGLIKPLPSHKGGQEENKNTLTAFLTRKSNPLNDPRGFIDVIFISSFDLLMMSLDVVCLLWCNLVRSSLVTKVKETWTNLCNTIWSEINNSHDCDWFIWKVCNYTQWPTGGAPFILTDQLISTSWWWWSSLAVSQFRSASFRGASEVCPSLKAPPEAPSSPCFWRMHRYDPSWPHISQDSLRTRKRRKKERKWRHRVV